MVLYRRKLPKPLAVDTPQIRAAINLVHAVESGQNPDGETLQVLHDAFREIFGGKHPTEIFGQPLGLVSPKGRPKGYGFTPADIVSAYIELRRRQLEPTHPTNALETAKLDAASAFVEFGGAVDAARAIDRDWAAGRGLVAALSDGDLHKIIAPYKCDAAGQIIRK
ncbi:MAG: hypothetical protein ABTS16_05755 [Candidatus Accumulibacter phosphatis]|jgi:hypothetical protein|uniref:Uncharacterized protein n=1 Tax=Candidatus Accumulibacter contiguus TaxID=2954381 RepID=A0ABX1TGG3_9PROT|nr:hypothetical protein [Candidatus Accumulibacter contiguus]NMQ07556.1 hypothetical protein [Candidatus Accumulibacter contiguus]